MSRLFPVPICLFLTGCVVAPTVQISRAQGPGGNREFRVQERGGNREFRATADWTLPRENAQRLRLSTPAGNLQVVAGQGNQIEVHAEKVINGTDAQTARQFLKEMKVDRRRENRDWVVEASWPQPPPEGIDSASVNLRITAPPGMDLQAQTRAGNVEAAGSAETRLDTGAGNVTARDIRGPVDAHSSAGNMQVEQCSGPLRVETSSGNVTVQHVQKAYLHSGSGNLIAQDVGGALDAHTAAGNIEFGDAAASVKASTNSGNITGAITRPGGQVQVGLDTSTGNVELSLPTPISAQLQASTGAGRIEIEGIENARSNELHTQGEALLGAGKGQVRLRTGAGNVTVRVGAPLR